MPFIRSLPTVPVVENAAVDEEEVVVAAVGVEAGGENARSSVSSALTTTAPAPSPNRTQVARSSQSRMRLNVSEPITSALSAMPLFSIESAIASA